MTMADLVWGITIGMVALPIGMVLIGLTMMVARHGLSAVHVALLLVWAFVGLPVAHSSGRLSNYLGGSLAAAIVAVFVFVMERWHVRRQGRAGEGFHV